MSQGLLCGDEVRAAVIDLGSYRCRFGAAGQDSPRHIFRTDVGIRNGNEMETDNNQINNSYIIGDRFHSSSRGRRECVECIQQEQQYLIKYTKNKE